MALYIIVLNFYSQKFLYIAIRGAITMFEIKIIIDDLAGGEVVNLLAEHLKDMYQISPPESVHALDINELKSPDLTFFSAWRDKKLLGCVAIKELTCEHVELKSMRTSHLARKSGIATKLLQHALKVAIERGYKKMSLETGSQDFFIPARNLYKKFKFRYCQPFSDYQEDINSKFMTRNL